MDCTVYRCSRQAEMYLYLLADRAPDSLPEALRQKTGRMTRVMDLQLSAERRLARVDVARVMERLSSQGWYLQLPPDGAMQGHLHFGD